ncbi:general secretion pathway protein GspD [Bdellovibrio bacteriovorus]|uniref:General secretion pathway protein GspD n=1 Tax=Bdellovibrio bacteriovorus TaxID=959 RepID=A0A150WMQ4_BDEBC|nr:hypothetical protein [Bdellovibrio bacteriovorus]KYG65654.1 general secretion pathway protein GspD [Bdellovibrio bacteriovorus]
MKLIAVILVFFTTLSVFADDKVKVNFNSEELTKVIENYAKATGQKFIIDPGVRGKITILNQEPITKEEFFSQLSNGLALNGFAISKQEDVMVVQSARNVQRNMLEVSTKRPSMKPQRMYTWVYTPKNVSVLQLNRDLRILPSRDGEMNVVAINNQLIITDWVSNINRVADVLEQIDIPENPVLSKLAKKGAEGRLRPRPPHEGGPEKVAPPTPPQE